MSNIESNCNWHFSEQEDATQDIGPNNAAAEYFSETPYPSLIRESIQNSLDAASDSSKPVRMEFSFKQLRTGSYPNFFNLRNHIESILKYYGNKAEAEYGPMLDVFHNFESNQAVIDYIKVSDFNTKGMDFNPNDTDSPFYAFVRAIGVTVKSDVGSGGSFGFGKAAYFSMSPIHTVLVSSRTQNGKTFFEGASTLCTHKAIGSDGKEHKYSHYGFYDNHSGEKPSSGEDIPTRFRREEAGSDIMIMGVDGSPEAQELAFDEMIKATLRNFWMSIYEKKLEVKIGDKEINASTLDDLMIEHFPDMRDREKKISSYNPRSYYEAVKNAGASKLFLKFDEKLQNLGEVSFYLFKNNELRDSVIHLRKQGMYIYRSRKYSSSYGYSAVFVCTDSQGNNLLKGIEDPSHSKWESTRNKIYGARLMTEIKDFIFNCLQKAFASDQGGVLGITGLEDYLFVPDDLIASNQDDEGNPLFGNPSNETSQSGLIPTSVITNAPNKTIASTESLGNVVIHKPDISATASSEGDYGGRKRSGNMPRKKGKGTNPGKDRFMPASDVEKGEYLENVPVSYRVIAENKNERLVHTLIIHSDYDVTNGQIEILVGGEDGDEEVDIISSSMGNVHENVISNIVLKKEDKNLIDIQFSDNMKHIVKLTMYEFR